jgi:hypothetical protein
VVIREKTEANKRIQTFWQNLFGTVRDFDPTLLDKLIKGHRGRFKPVPRKVVEKGEVLKLLRRGNKSGAGPDSIPFSLYKTSAEPLLQMWVDLIQAAGEVELWDKNFLLSQLCLIPKVDTGFPRVEEFRPICITNADYRIVTRYWALWLASMANEVLSGSQHALLPGQRIDDDNWSTTK